MVYVIGASSLNATIGRVPYNVRRELFGRSYSLGGLSFNWNAKNPLKVLQNLLTGRGVLARKYKVIIWHDIINNSISKHRSNNYRAISVENLLQILRDFSHRIEAVVYCRREGAPDNFRKLLESKITILDVKSNLLSHRNSKDFIVLHDLKQTHPSTELEARLLSTVWRHRKNLKFFYKNNKKKSKPCEPKKQNKPSKKEREKAKPKKEKLSSSCVLQ